MDQQPACRVRGTGTGDLAGSDSARLASSLCARRAVGRVNVFDSRDRRRHRALEPQNAAALGGARVKDARANTAPVPLGPLGTSRRLPAVLSDYVALTKPRLNVLVVATSAAGYYLGSATPPAPWSMAQAVCGTALVAAGSAVLN